MPAVPDRHILSSGLFTRQFQSGQVCGRGGGDRASCEFFPLLSTATKAREPFCASTPTITIQGLLSKPMDVGWTFSGHIPVRLLHARLGKITIPSHSQRNTTDSIHGGNQRRSSDQHEHPQRDTGPDSVRTTPTASAWSSRRNRGRLSGDHPAALVCEDWRHPRRIRRQRR